MKGDDANFHPLTNRLHFLRNISTAVGLLLVMDVINFKVD